MGGTLIAIGDYLSITDFVLSTQEEQRFTDQNNCNKELQYYFLYIKNQFNK